MGNETQLRFPKSRDHLCCHLSIKITMNETLCLWKRLSKF